MGINQLGAIEAPSPQVLLVGENSFQLGGKIFFLKLQMSFLGGEGLGFYINTLDINLYAIRHVPQETQRQNAWSSPCSVLSSTPSAGTHVCHVQTHIYLGFMWLQ